MRATLAREIDVVPFDYVEWKLFMSRVSVPEDRSECWRWNELDGNHYGRFKYRGRCYLATRLMFAQVNGVLSPNLMVCHECDHPWCVNPRHLRQDTNRANQLDAARRGRFPMQRPDVAESRRIIKADALPAIVARLNAGESGRSISLSLGLSINLVNRALSRAGIPNPTKPGRKAVSK